MAAPFLGTFVAYSASPVSKAPETKLPNVTGIWFQIHHWVSVIGAPNSMPVGIKNMFTIEWSYPCAKNVIIGNHIATTLPIVEREAMASTAPSVTIQLHKSPLMKAVSHPRSPIAMYAMVFFCAADFINSPHAPLPPVQQLVTAKQNSKA